MLLAVKDESLERTCTLLETYSGDVNALMTKVTWKL